MEKNNLEFQDGFVESVLQNADHTILTIDFENQLMKKVRANHSYKKEVTSRLKKSMFYFLIGILLIILYPLVSILRKPLFESSTNILSVSVLFFSIIIGVITIDNYRRFFQSL